MVNISLKEEEEVVVVVDLMKQKPPKKLKRKKVRLFGNRKLNLKLLDDYPGSYFMDVRCNGCFFVTTIHSHPQDWLPCPGCGKLLCMPSETPGGHCTLRPTTTFWRKTDKSFNAFVRRPTLPAY
ncbi:40s ribosomal protein s27 [Artemisia annua]|uniref:40s ribosomal protein s27 n=1 Tax=Artemisia annua TaxID=35608 RepID=A0A2U1KQ51_ARTAN|nr:40s ribosomal protein s27 [Artemisia annua]